MRPAISTKYGIPSRVQSRSLWMLACVRSYGLLSNLSRWEWNIQSLRKTFQLSWRLSQARRLSNSFWSRLWTWLHTKLRGWRDSNYLDNYRHRTILFPRWLWWRIFIQRRNLYLLCWEIMQCQLLSNLPYHTNPEPTTGMWLYHRPRVWKDLLSWSSRLWEVCNSSDQRWCSLFNRWGGRLFWRIQINRITNKFWTDIIGDK